MSVVFDLYNTLFCCWQALYDKGVSAYDDEKWHDAVQFFENAVSQYYQEHGQCIAACDAPFDSASFSEFYRKVYGTASLERQSKLTMGKSDNLIYV